MHLRKPSKLHKGDRVHTGERIGQVGQSGNASGCHLHMEEWSAPGWYQGGHFVRGITRHLKKWDRWSLSVLGAWPTCCRPGLAT